MKSNCHIKSVLFLLLWIPVFGINAKDMVPGELWLDISGNLINAHAGDQHFIEAASG